MSRFLEDALQIFETAQSASDNAGAQMAILIGHDGALRMVDSTGWRPEALQYHYGARTVYQITRTPGSVKVSGLSGGQSCIFETARPATLCQPSFPQYAIAAPRLITEH